MNSSSNGNQGLCDQTGAGPSFRKRDLEVAILLCLFFFIGLSRVQAQTKVYDLDEIKDRKSVV